MPRAQFDALAREWPEAGHRLLMNMALELAFRLRRNNRLVLGRQR